MINGLIPPAITVMAATSRLIDLQHSRGASVYIPEAAPNSGIYTGIALLALNTLHDLERERGTGYITVVELFSIIKQSASDITLEDLEFVLLSLSKEREICFSVPDENGVLAHGHVRDKTKLVDLAESRGQVRITNNASLFLRICEDEISWLYDESDAGKIITALNNHKFNDIPVICRGISLELAKKARELTELIEHPTREEQSRMLISDGPAINENLKKTKGTIQNALHAILEQSTIDAFSQWATVAKPDFEIGNLHAELEVLLQSVEAVTRRFVEFLDVAQQLKDVVPSHYQFLEMANRMVSSYDHSTIPLLESFLQSVTPADFPGRWFSPSVLPGMIDLYDLMDNENVQPPKSYDITDVEPQSVKRFMDFIERNREAIYTRLSAGPILFSEFLSSTDFIVGEGDSALDFLGIYVSPHVLDGNDGDPRSVIVGFSQNVFNQKSGDFTIISSDPVIMLGP